MSIAPKPHASKRQASKTLHEPQSEEAKPVPRHTVLRVLPSKLFVDLPVNTGADGVAFVSSATYASLFPGETSISPIKSSFRCQLDLIAPPTNPVSKKNGTPDIAEAPKILNPRDADAGDQVEEKPGTSVYVFVRKEIPNNHAVFVNTPSEVKEWDRVKYFSVIVLPLKKITHRNPRLTTTSSSWTSLALSDASSSDSGPMYVFSAQNHSHRQLNGARQNTAFFFTRRGRIARAWSRFLLNNTRGPFD